MRKRAHYPAPQEDVAAILSFVFSHAEKWQVDTENYAVCGFSAGGHVAGCWGAAKLGYEKYGLPKPAALTAALADGWYRGSNGPQGRRNSFGTQTKLFVQLELYDSEGKITRICTDGSWAWSNDGPIRFADLRDGERVDASKSPTYSKKAKPVKCKANLTASDNVLVREHERFSPEQLIITPSGKKVLKFPQNLSGYLCFRLSARAGQRIRIRLGEMMKDGEFTQKNIQNIHKGKPTPLQEIDYLCRDGTFPLEVCLHADGSFFDSSGFDVTKSYHMMGLTSAGSAHSP